MVLHTSTQFASVAVNGTDWRDTAKKCLEELEAVRTGGHNFNFGFLYVTDHLAEDAHSILSLFRSVMQIDNWIGGVGVGIFGSGEVLIDRPGISALIGRIPEEQFALFSYPQEEEKSSQDLASWVSENDPMLVFVHGNPLSYQDPASLLRAVDEQTGGFLLGGLVSSRKDIVQFTNGISQSDLSGAAFSKNVKIASMISQGCEQIGVTHNITRGQDYVIKELDGIKAIEAFENDLRSMAVKKIEKDPDMVVLDDAVLEDPEKVPEEYKALFTGEVHAAFPISESDQKDYLVRNIISLDPDEGSITVAQRVSPGERVMFIHRNDETVISDLSHSLVKLRQRVEHEEGSFEPKAGLYVSCLARASAGQNYDMQGEIDLIREIIGEIPLTGFYASGEINKGRLYGYTGILTLFL